MTAAARIGCSWTRLYDPALSPGLWAALEVPTPSLADGRRLVARRDHGPLGMSELVVTVLPGATGCLVQVEEDFVTGAGLELPRPVRTLALERRNQRILDLLAARVGGTLVGSPWPLPVRVLLEHRPQLRLPPRVRVPARPAPSFRLPTPPRPSFRLPTPPRPSFRLPPRPRAPFRLPPRR